MIRGTITSKFFILLFAAACYFPLFLHLDHMSVRLWDEGRRAVNAFEMAQSGNYLVTQYEGQPEMWGTKPPLLLWCESFFMKTIGYNEVALRLPSALAALATVILLVMFGWKVLKRPLVGFLAGLVLVTTKGYVGAHVARSGDFDSLLTLWETAYLLSFFTFFTHNDSNKKKKWLYITAGFIALAGLTKGIAGFLFMPGLLVFYLLFQKTQENEQGHLANLVSWRHTWLALVLAVLPLATFYLLREIYNPGYLAAVMDNEVGGRYLETQGGHNHPWYHYFEFLWKEQFQPWLLFIPLGLVVGFWQKGRFRQLTWLLLLNSVIFLLVISYAKTRILWYMAPVYPSLALLVGIGLERLVSGASQLISSPTPSSNGKSNLVNYALLAAFVVALFYQPYRFIIERVYFEQHPAWDWPELKYRDFMRQVKDVKNYTIVHAKYNSHVVFYAKTFNLDGHHIQYHPLEDFNWNRYEFGKEPLEFSSGDTLMVCEKQVHIALDSVYQYEVLRNWDSCKLLVIKGDVGSKDEMPDSNGK